MKLGYSLANILGAVYTGGTIRFLPSTPSVSGNSLCVPVGNRVSIIDLAVQRIEVLPFEHARPISIICLSPDGRVLLSIDDEGRAFVSSLYRKSVLHRINFRQPVRSAHFNPKGTLLAVARGRHVQLWGTPQMITRSVAPFSLLRTLGGHHEQVNAIDWSPRGSRIVSGGRDGVVRVHAVNRGTKVPNISFGAHRSAIVGCFFDEAGYRIVSVSSDGCVCIWITDEAETDAVDGLLSSTRVEEEDGDRTMDNTSKSEQEKGVGEWRLHEKYFLNQRSAQGSANVSSITLPDTTNVEESESHLIQPRPTVAHCSFHRKSSLLSAGMTNGVVGIWELAFDAISGEGCNRIHALSVSTQRLDSVELNDTGEWLVFASERLGQLCVWEWRSETYVMRQQGHSTGETLCCAYSPDGQVAVSGGRDGKIKLWNAASGFCFVTFTQHTGSVTGVCVQPNGKAIFSCSTDGTVRAFDLSRYRNFKTFTAPTATPFSCIALDLSGEIVCAGSSVNGSIFVWSVRTGAILEVLQRHEGPVSHVAFSPLPGRLASSSWDGSVFIWDVYGSGSSVESFPHHGPVLTLAYRPDGREMVTSTLDGTLTFWDIESAAPLGTIDARRDARGGRAPGELRSAANVSSGAAFSSLAYSADGQLLLAGGKTRFVCLYHAPHRVLLRRYPLTESRAFVQEFLSSKNMTEAGPRALLPQTDGEDWDAEDRRQERESLPGVRSGAYSSDGGKRSVGREALSHVVVWAPSSRSFAASTPEGVLIFSLDSTEVFDPLELDCEITPASIEQAVAAGGFQRALCMALRLNDNAITQVVIGAIPGGEMPHVSSTLAPFYLPLLLSALSRRLPSEPSVELTLMWISCVFRFHSRIIRSHSFSYQPLLRTIRKEINERCAALASLASSNVYTVSYLCTLADGKEESLPPVADQGEEGRSGGMMLDGQEPLVEVAAHEKAGDELEWASNWRD